MIPDSILIQLDRLRDAPTNPNEMDPEDYARLVEVIRRAGFLQPILIRPIGTSGEYEIIDGHHRVRAAKEVGMVEIPAVLTDGAGHEALRIGMNRLRGQLDLTKVGQVLADLAQLNWSMEDLMLTGFSADEIQDLIGSAAEESLDDIMAQATAAADEAEEQANPKPFSLELVFASREELVVAKKALRKAAGKGGEMSTGLLRLIGER